MRYQIPTFILKVSAEIPFSSFPIILKQTYQHEYTIKISQKYSEDVRINRRTKKQNLEIACNTNREGNSEKCKLLGLYLQKQYSFNIYVWLIYEAFIAYFRIIKIKQECKVR